jgi:hypothetical protein
MKHILLKCALMGAAVILGSIGAQAAWVYDSTAGTLSDGNYTFKAKVVTKTDPSKNAEVTGFEVTGTTVGSGDLDFTDVGKDLAGTNVISLKQDWTNNRFVNSIESCTKLTAPHVLELDTYLFFGNNHLKEIVLSDGDEVKVTEIPERCFNTENSVLEKITPTKFPYVKTITKTFTFRGASALKGDFSFPILTCIGNGAFMGTAITGFSAPKLEEFEDSYGAFRGCSSLTGDLYFAELKYVGNCAFYQASKITSFVAPKATYVMQYAFNDTPALTNVQLAANVTSYGESAFCSAKLVTFSPMPIVLSNLANTYNNNGVVQDLPKSFKECSSLVGSFEIIGTSELKTLTSAWLQKHNAITNVTIKAPALETVGDYAVRLLAPGATIYWESEKAPTAFGTDAFCSTDKNNRSRIYVTSDLDGWLKLGTAVTAEDKERTDFPKRAFCVINGNVYVVDGRAGLCIRIQ